MYSRKCIDLLWMWQYSRRYHLGPVYGSSLGVWRHFMWPSLFVCFDQIIPDTYLCSTIEVVSPQTCSEYSYYTRNRDDITLKIVLEFFFPDFFRFFFSFASFPCSTFVFLWNRTRWKARWGWWVANPWLTTTCLTRRNRGKNSRVKHFQTSWKSHNTIHIDKL